jgi:hypothetical protein
MSDNKSIPLESEIYEIAKLLVLLRFHAENQWCDVESDPGNEIYFRALGRDVRILQTAATEAAANLKPNEGDAAFIKLAEVIEEFWSQFRIAWRNGERAEKVKRIRKIDNEFEYERSRQMYMGSPMEDGKWALVQAAVDSVRNELHSPLKECYNLGLLLGSEVYPTFTDGQRLRDSDTELGFQHTDFTKNVQQTMARLSEDLPFFSRLKFILPVADERQVVEKIYDFWDLIGKSLRDPSTVPGYLGLVLDRKNGWIYRYNDRQHLAESKTRWGILERLEKRGDAPIQFQSSDKCAQPLD